MKRFILFFILSLLLIAFSAFFINTYELQKNYFDNVNTKGSPKPLMNDVLEKNTQSTYLDYSKNGYDKAFSFRGITVLYFTSNWCQTCINQDAINTDVFNVLIAEGITNIFGLRVHILDSETTIETDALAKKYGVTKEQTFVILDKGGGVFYKFTGELSQENLVLKIKEVVNK